MIDHISLAVSDLARAAVFYDAVLASLGYVRLFTTPRGIGYGVPGAKDEAFAISRRVSTQGRRERDAISR